MSDKLPEKPKNEPEAPKRYRVLRGVTWAVGDREVSHDEGVYISAVPPEVLGDLLASGAIEEVTRG